MSDMPNFANNSFDEIMRLAQAGREALTDGMVERLSVTGVAALELADRLNEPATSDAVHNFLDRMTQLHQMGALDTIFDMVVLVHALRNAATDSIVDRLFSFFEQMVNSVGTEEMGSLAVNTHDALVEAAEEASKGPERTGLFATLAMLSRPECMRSLQFLLCFAGKLQKRAAGAP